MENIHQYPILRLAKVTEIVRFSRVHLIAPFLSIKESKEEKTAWHSGDPFTLDAGKKVIYPSSS